MGWLIIFFTVFLSPDLIDSLLKEPSVQTQHLSNNILRVSSNHQTNSQKFLIHIRRRVLHGSWESYYPNQQICDSGSFLNNIPDGEWRSYYPDGTIRTVRNYSAEKFQYIRQELLRRHSKIFKYPIVRMANNKEDISQYFQPDHKLMPSGKMSLMERIDINTNPETNNYISPFTKSLHHGLFINYNPDGNLIDSGSYVNGLKHGYWKTNSGDEIITGKYSHGSKTGQWKHFTPQGGLIYTEYYSREGKLHHAHDFEGK